MQLLHQNAGLLQVPFVMIEYRNLSLMSLMSYGLHALPVLQVTAKGKKFRYSGKHHLGTMVQFVARALVSQWWPQCICN